MSNMSIFCSMLDGSKDWRDTAMTEKIKKQRSDLTFYLFYFPIFLIFGKNAPVRF